MELSINKKIVKCTKKLLKFKVVLAEANSCVSLGFGVPGNMGNSKPLLILFASVNGCNKIPDVFVSSAYYLINSSSLCGFRNFNFYIEEKCSTRWALEMYLFLKILLTCKCET